MANAEIVELERRVNELRALYENYFAGVEKREPLRLRETLASELRRYELGKTTTQTQFRLNNLRTRFQTLESHWNRVVKQIEEGTFRKKRSAPTAPSPPAPVQAPPPKPALEDAAMRALYKQYSEARAKTGEATMSYDAMVSSLRKQVPMVIERYKCHSVDFKVAVKDGKTIIRAVPIT